MPRISLSFLRPRGRFSTIFRRLGKTVLILLVVGAVAVGGWYGYTTWVPASWKAWSPGGEKSGSDHGKKPGKNPGQNPGQKDGPEPTTAAAAAEQYFARLARGDTEAALRLVDDQARAGKAEDWSKQPALGSKVLSSADSRPRDVTVSPPSNNRSLWGLTQVDVSYKVGDSQVKQRILVRKVGGTPTAPGGRSGGEPDDGEDRAPWWWWGHDDSGHEQQGDSRTPRAPDAHGSQRPGASAPAPAGSATGSRKPGKTKAPAKTTAPAKSATPPQGGGGSKGSGAASAAPPGAGERYRLVQPFLRLRIASAAGRAVTVNGVALDAEASRDLRVFPGAYTVVARGNALLSEETVRAVPHQERGASVATLSATFGKAKLADGAKEAVQNQVKTVIDSCLKSQEAMPKDCPFGSLLLVDRSRVQWSVTTYPEVTVSLASSVLAGGSYVRVSTGKTVGKVHYARAEGKDDWPWDWGWPKEGDMEFRVEGRACVDKDAVKVSLDWAA